MTDFFKSTFKPRVYQQTIFAKILQKNSLVVLPTGLGKTAIAVMLGAAKLNNNKKKVLILAPTRPLVNQHLDSFQEFINPSFLHEDEYIVFTGQIKAEKRAELWKDARVIFSTPQGLENDILAKRISLDDVALIVFDEAHRATGDYSYNWIASQYVKQNPQAHILALTASPGTDQEVIDEVCQNLHIEHIESRTRESHDVKPYVKHVNVDWEEVHLPLSFTEVLLDLKKIYDTRLKQIQPFLGLLNKNSKYLNKRDLLTLQAKIQGQISMGEADATSYQAVSIVAQLLKLQHAIELLETQGVPSAKKFMEDIWKQGQKQKSKASVSISIDPLFKSALTKIWKLDEAKVDHPKIPRLVEIVKQIFHEKADSKIIIFNNYRDSIKHLHKQLEGEDLVNSAIFVGQAKKSGTGLTQKKQLELIKEFREGIHNVLIMSSVGEEGLDIPAVDVVIFYEPVPSAIRQIQRTGRTGRQEEGRVIIMCAKGTRDVAYKWSTINKEKKMNDLLGNAQTVESVKPVLKDSSQRTLDQVVPKSNVLVVDSREKSNRIVKQLVDKDIEIELKQIPVADYIIGEDVGIEFKTQKDFVDSLVDGRLLEQAASLARTFAKPLFVVQGDGDLYSQRNISPLAIQGALSSIATSFRIPVLFTRNEDETVNLFHNLIQKNTKDTVVPLHTAKPKEDKDLQEFIVGSLPGIGPSLAKELLNVFGSVEYIMTADVDELASIKQMGSIKAQKIKDILQKKYTTQE